MQEILIRIQFKISDNHIVEKEMRVHPEDLARTGLPREILQAHGPVVNFLMGTKGIHIPHVQQVITQNKGKKIELIKVLRNFARLTLVEAKDLVESGYERPIYLRINDARSACIEIQKLGFPCREINEDEISIAETMTS